MKEVGPPHGRWNRFYFAYLETTLLMKNDFCVDALTTDSNLRGDYGVLRVPALAVTTDAYAAAEKILQSARNQATALLDAAHEEARQAVQTVEQQALESAAQFLHSLEQMRAMFLQRAENLVLDLAQGLFDRLVRNATPRERLEAMLKQVLAEAPPKLVNPLLRVHPEDMALLPPVEWDVKEDVSLARGVCRLEASNGEWCADFDAAVTALKMAWQGAAGEDVVAPDEK